jgi:hypothetical protein
MPSRFSFTPFQPFVDMHVTGRPVRIRDRRQFREFCREHRVSPYEDSADDRAVRRASDTEMRQEMAAERKRQLRRRQEIEKLVRQAPEGGQFEQNAKQAGVTSGPGMKRVVEA